jgi:type III pantothenate kinase
MAPRRSFPLIAIDVGNSRIKLGDFEQPLAQPLPHPNRAVALGLDFSDDQLLSWLPGARKPADYTWTMSSVNRPIAQRLIDSLKRLGVPSVQVLVHADLPLKIELPAPERVGMDRLVNALAARALRTVPNSAIVVAVGSAIIVDRVSAEGAFVGGSILPGPDMSARALHEFTDRLPLVEVTEPEAPLGRSTVEAMQFGLYWGAIGAIRELIARLAEGETEAEVFITGGGAAGLIANLTPGGSRPPQFVPHLTLAGIALAMLNPTQSLP